LKASESAGGVGQVINVANGERISLNELLGELKSLTGKTDVVADYREPRAGDVKHSLADISRARNLLGFEPRVDLRTGLQQTIAWWKTSRFAKT
jgi:nucleoside-diphosphate-sugar epimerase